MRATRRTLQQRQLVRNWCEVLERPGVNVLTDHAVALLVEKTYLRAEDVSLLYTDFVVDGEKMTVKVFARCTVMSLMGRAIEYNLDSLAPKFAELVAAKLGEGYGGSIDKVTLRPYVNWAMVIIL